MTTKTAITIRLTVLLLIAGLFFIYRGCFMCPSIESILSNPQYYSNKTICISGKVISSTSFIVNYYTINDGTGEITVRTQKAVPNEGTAIKINGKIHQYFKLPEDLPANLSGKSLVVFFEE